MEGRPLYGEGGLDNPCEHSRYNAKLLGGESPVTIEGVGANKNRLQSLYLYHQFKGNKLIMSKFLRKSDYMHVRRQKKLTEILPRIPGAMDSTNLNFTA